MSNRYDLHPVVRGVAWSSLDPDTRHDIDLRLAEHLGEVPEVDKTAVTCVDDLSNAIELYHTLVRLGWLNDASKLLRHRITEPLMLLGGYRYLAELARTLIEDPDWLQEIASADKLHKAAIACLLMGVGYQLAGDPVRALDPRPFMGMFSILTTMAAAAGRRRGEWRSCPASRGLGARSHRAPDPARTRESNTCSTIPVWDRCRLAGCAGDRCAGLPRPGRAPELATVGWAGAHRVLGARSRHCWSQAAVGWRRRPYCRDPAGWQVHQDHAGHGPPVGGRRAGAAGRYRQGPVRHQFRVARYKGVLLRTRSFTCARSHETACYYTFPRTVGTLGGIGGAGEGAGLPDDVQLGVGAVVQTGREQEGGGS